MGDKFDLIILGGGCAGLSLATRLATQSPEFKTLILESADRYTNNRTWCYWAVSDNIKSQAFNHEWGCMRLTAGKRVVEVDCTLTPYRMLSAEKFYAQAVSTISKAPNISLRLGCHVQGEPLKADKLWRVNVGAESFSSTAVVDTRPQRRPVRNAALLWQSFYGFEIECDRAVFDPASIDLMNFLPADALGIPFVYVLPTASNRALIELTVFGPEPLYPEDLSARLSTAIADRVMGAGFKVLRSERGILPMGLPPTEQNIDPSFVTVGVTAGAARPSTGFAFQRIQTWADACAQSLCASGLPIVHAPDPLLVRTMDRIFLKTIRDQPQHAANIFCSLFDGGNPASVIRFLSGHGSWLDYLSVAAALPPMPFIRQIPRLRQRPIHRLAADLGA